MSRLRCAAAILIGLILQFCLAGNAVAAGPIYFHAPTGIAISKSGNIWVVDSLNNRLQEFDQYGNLLQQIGSEGGGKGQFFHPLGIAIDGQDNILVVDSGNDRIEKFDSNGKFLTRFSDPDQRPFYTLHYPKDIAIDGSGNIWVADGNFHLQKYNPEGKCIGRYDSTSGQTGIQDSGGDGIAIDSAGNTYVGLFKFDSSGRYLGTIGPRRNDGGPALQAAGIAIDKNGNILISNNGGPDTDIQMLDGEGNYLKVFGSYGGGNGEFQTAGALAIDAAGNILVADPKLDRIQKFDRDGQYITQWGQPNPADMTALKTPAEKELIHKLKTEIFIGLFFVVSIVGLLSLKGEKKTALAWLVVNGVLTLFEMMSALGVLFMGTFFFDDPHASYLAFFMRIMGYLIAPLVLFIAACWMAIVKRYRLSISISVAVFLLANLLIIIARQST